MIKPEEAVMRIPDLQLIGQRTWLVSKVGIVLCDWAFTLWGLMLTSGRWYQNWVELLDTQLRIWKLQRFSLAGSNRTPDTVRQVRCFWCSRNEKSTCVSLVRSSCTKGEVWVTWHIYVPHTMGVLMPKKESGMGIYFSVSATTSFCWEKKQPVCLPPPLSLSLPNTAIQPQAQQLDQPCSKEEVRVSV